MENLYKNHEMHIFEGLFLVYMKFQKAYSADVHLKESEEATN